MDFQRWYTAIQAKREPKSCLRRKILTFALGTHFSWNFFYLKDWDHDKVLQSKFCVQHQCRLRYEKQNKMVVTHFDNVALLLVPEERVIPDTKNVPDYLDVITVFQTKKSCGKKPHIAKVRIFLLRRCFGVYLLAWISVENSYVYCKNQISMKNADFSKRFFS